MNSFINVNDCEVEEMGKRHYTYIFEEFKTYYASDEYEIVKWEPAGGSEIVVYYDNGIRVRYDSVTKSVYSMHPRRNPDQFIDDDIYAKRFAWKLRAVVNASGFTRDDICNRTGISKAALSGYMTGKKLPGAINIYKLTNVLDCSVEELLNVGDWDK
jgi:DNA-binding Xre family transcriptional regulator